MMIEEYSFDKQNRMQYHPDFHTNQGNVWSLEDLEYLCKFWEVDPMRTVAFALGRTETTCASKIQYLKSVKNEHGVSMYEVYKKRNHYY
jgi:hypothetical protein